MLFGEPKTYYQMHWRRGISRLVYQNPVINVSPLEEISIGSGVLLFSVCSRSNSGLKYSHQDCAL